MNLQTLADNSALHTHSETVASGKKILIKNTAETKILMLQFQNADSKTHGLHDGAYPPIRM